jgi:hypothetical protein
MAKLFNLNTSKAPELHGMTKFYDVTSAVGIPIAPGDPENPANDYLDVLLIQYLLEKYYEGETFRPAGKLLLDGIFGPLTHYWMLFFYVEMESENETSMFQERGNIISWARNGEGRFGNNMADSLIGLLNHGVFTRHQQTFNELVLKDPKFPPALRHHLTSRVGGRGKGA